MLLISLGLEGGGGQRSCHPRVRVTSRSETIIDDDDGVILTCTSVRKWPRDHHCAVYLTRPHGPTQPKVANRITDTQVGTQIVFPQVCNGKNERVREIPEIKQHVPAHTCFLWETPCVIVYHGKEVKKTKVHLYISSVHIAYAIMLTDVNFSHNQSHGIASTLILLLLNPHDDI